MEELYDSEQDFNASKETKACPPLSNSVKFPIFSYLSANFLFLKISKLNHAHRKLLEETKFSKILNLGPLIINVQKTIMKFDEAYMLNFSPSVKIRIDLSDSLT